MPNPIVNRKSAFKAALLLSNQNMTSFAYDQNVTLGHLSMVLHSRRDSNRLNGEIDAVISRYLPRQSKKSA